MNAVDRLVATARLWQPAWQRQLPSPAVFTGARLLPAVLLVLPAALAGVAAIALVATTRGPIGVLAVLMAAGLWWRDAAAPGVFAIAVAVAHLIGTDGTAWLATAGLVALLPAWLLSVVVTAGVPLGARIEVRVVREPARSWLLVQAITQPLVVVAAVLSASDRSSAWLPVLAAAGLVGFGWWVYRRQVAH